MKILKTALKTLAAFLLAIVLIWTVGRYGWKLLGFRACSGSGISYVAVSDAQVEIKGFYPGSFPSGCVGTISKVTDDKLYLGVKYDGLFGIFELGSFDTVIPVQQEIRQIYLKTSSDEYLIWDAETDPPVVDSGFFGH